MALIALIRRRGVPGGRRAKAVLAGARALRRLAVLRRQHDHPGDLGPVRDRRRQGLGAVTVRPGHPDHGSDHRRPVPGPASGHGRRGTPVRPGHGYLVCGDRRARRARHRSPPGDPQGAVTDLCPGLPVQPLRDRVLLAGRRRPGRHRSRGALRGHGALRPRADHARLADPRLPRLHPQLHGPGRPCSGPSGQHKQPVLPARTGVGAAPDGLPGRRGDRHRLTGRDHRRVLGREPGRPARLPSAAAHRVYLGRADRPDLRPVDQLAAPGHRPHARRHVQELSRAGLRVRRGRDRHDHDHDPAVLLRRPLPVAQTMVDRRARRRHPPHRGPPVLRRQPDQAAPRSMASAADRHRRVHRLYHLAEGPRTGHPSA